MTEAEIKREIAVAWEYAYRHDDWIEPLDAALAGLPAEAAAWRPRPDARSIWDVVLHLALWNENIVARVESGERVHPPEGASWPAPSSALDEAAWEAAKTRLRDSYEAVRTLIDATPLDRLQGGYGLADLLCRLTHSGYHLGQIVKLRESL